MLFAQILGDGLGAGVDVEFFVDAGDGFLHRPVADAKLPGDFLKQQALDQRIEDLPLAGPQMHQIGGGHGGRGGSFSEGSQFLISVANALAHFDVADEVTHHEGHEEHEGMKMEFDTLSNMVIVL